MNKDILDILDEEQRRRFRAWKDQHAAEAHAKGVRDFTGAAFRFVILPTSIGDNIHVECIWCKGVGVNLTKDDYDEFIFNVDGTPNGWKGSPWAPRT